MQKIPSLTSLAAETGSIRYSGFSQKSGSGLLARLSRSGSLVSFKGQKSTVLSKTSRLETQSYEAVDIELARGISIRRSLRGFGRVWRYNPGTWSDKERAGLYELSRPGGSSASQPDNKGTDVSGRSHGLVQSRAPC